METNDYLVFARKTKKIVKDEYSGKNEVTLLINCSIGLLFVAQQKYNGILSVKSKPSDLLEWGVVKEDVKCCKHRAKTAEKKYDIEDEKITVCAVCRHIRNSIAHCHFSFLNKKGKIVGLHLKDYVGNTLTFDLKIKVENLRKFLFAVEDYIQHKASKQKKS